MEFLKEKLDNKDVFVARVKQETRLSLEQHLQSMSNTAMYAVTSSMAGTGLNDTDNFEWWWVREALRMKYSIYKQTDTLKIVNGLNRLVFAHISLEDPKMVAYTPDRSFGTSDRQLRLNIGKLLSKLFPVFTDFYIASLAADHEAEISGHIDFVEGSKIAEVYASGYAPHSCMAEKPAFRGIMPSLAYDMPGIKMAVIKVGEKYTARCMVYENGDDKRYIRNYGDQKLEQRLKRAGYRMGNWNGVEFKPIRVLKRAGEETDIVDPTPIDPDELNTYDMTLPYLDANGGSGSGYGSEVFMLGGKVKAFRSEQERQMIQALTQDAEFTREAAEKGIQVNLKVFPDSLGRQRLTNIPSRYMEIECGLTGEKLSRIHDDIVNVWHDGKLVRTRLKPEYVVVRTPDEEAVKLGAALYYVQAGTALFKHIGYQYRECEENRKALGFLKLDAKYYPDTPEELANEWYTHLFKTKDGYGIFASDVVKLVVSETEITTIHKSEVQKKVHVKLHPSGPHDGYALAALVKKTKHGRKVHPLYNDIFRTFEGFDLPRNVDMSTVVYYQDEAFYFSKGDKPDTRLAQYEKFVTSAVEASIAVSTDLPALVRAFALDSRYQTQNVIVTTSVPGLERLGKVVTVKDADRMTLDELEIACQYWYKHSSMDVAIMLNRILLKIAEAKANDYTNPPVATPQQPSVDLEVTEVQIQKSEACHV